MLPEWTITEIPPKPPKRDEYDHKLWESLYGRREPKDADRYVRAFGRILARMGKLDGEAMEQYIERRTPFVQGGDQYAFREIVRHVPDGTTVREVGSYRSPDTPRELYRLLYLTAPKRLDLSDMYKTGAGMIALGSACGRFYVFAELWKYELGLRFYVTPTIVAKVAIPMVRFGGVAVDHGVLQMNGEVTIVPKHEKSARLFFDTIIAALQTSWPVYPGNYFQV